MPSTSQVFLPFLSRPAAMAFGRLQAIAGRWPSLFADVLHRQQAPGSLRAAIALVVTGRPDGPLPQLNPAEEILLGAAIAQRGFNVTLEVSSSIMLGYVPNPDTVTPRAVILLPPDFVRWATNDPQGCTSIAATERYIRDVDPIRYRHILASMRAPEPNEEQLLGMEKALCDVRVIKNAHRIWQQLDPETRDTLLALGYRVPDPWRVYVAGGDVNSDTVRALTLAAYAVEDAEDYFSQRSPTGDAMPPMVLWRLGRLDAFRPPDSVQSAFRAPTESGFVLPETLLSRIALCKTVARNPQNPAYAKRLQDVMRLMGDQRVAQQAVRWMTDYAPDPAQIAPAFEQLQRRTGALGWGRAVLVPDDLWLNILVGYRGAFCGTGWSPLMAFHTPNGATAPSMSPGYGTPRVPPHVPTRTPPRQPPRRPPTKVPVYTPPPVQTPVYTPVATPVTTPIARPTDLMRQPTPTTPVQKLIQQQTTNAMRAQAARAAQAQTQGQAAIQNAQAHATANAQKQVQKTIQTLPSGAVVTPGQVTPVKVTPTPQPALSNTAMQPVYKLPEPSAVTTKVDQMVKSVISNAAVRPSTAVPATSIPVTSPQAIVTPVNQTTFKLPATSTPTTTPTPSTGSCAPGTVPSYSGGKLVCSTPKIAVSPSVPSSGGGYSSASYGGKVPTPGRSTPAPSYATTSFSAPSDLAGPPTTGCGCSIHEDY